MRGGLYGIPILAQIEKYLFGNGESWAPLNQSGEQNKILT
jgi:hypothetical protein